MANKFQHQEHTHSYYAATVNEKTGYPALQGAKSTDVCVVGGGFTGVATALTLAERGYCVALIEANRIGWGASGRNGGQLINGISGLAKIRKKHGEGIADMLWDLKWRGNDIVHDRVTRYGIACDLKNGFVGGLGGTGEKGLVPRPVEHRSRVVAHPAVYGHVGADPRDDLDGAHRV